MATIGQQLLQPESGWKRYDDRDANIDYIGTWTTSTSVPSRYYNSTTIATSIIGDYCQFNFTGNKIRIISFYDPSLSQSVEISIDNKIYSYSLYGSSTVGQVLVFEKTDLSIGEHFVKITNKQAKVMSIDAIDIDDVGELKTYKEFKKKYLIQNKTNNNIYTLDTSGNIILSPSQIIDENNYLNNGFDLPLDVSQIMKLKNIDDMSNFKLLMYTDNTNSVFATLNYSRESYRPVDIANSKFDINMYK